MAKKTAQNAAIALLISAIGDLVIEIVESKCQKLTARERSTLQRRIARAVTVFAQGPQQKRAEAARHRGDE